LYKRNIRDLNSLKALTRQLNIWNRFNHLPLFISLDEEGGTVSRMPEGCSRFPDARNIGQSNDPSVTYKIGLMIGRELTCAGINLNYAPVFDVLSNPRNMFLYWRSFGASPVQVATHGIATIRGMRMSHVLAAAKHFPGHGDTDTDSHGRLPVIRVDRQRMDDRELFPYRRAIEEGLDAIMVGHLSYPDIDTSGAPASLSGIFMKNILRDELGYEGLIITDEIEMQAFMRYHDSVEATAVISIQSGADMLMIGHTQSIQIRVMRALKRAVSNHTISEKMIDEKVTRILKIKLKYQLSHQLRSAEPCESMLRNYRAGYQQMIRQRFPDSIKKDSMYAH
jgi:beta-N-acetylhexosaminidase